MSDDLVEAEVGVCEWMREGARLLYEGPIFSRNEGLNGSLGSGGNRRDAASGVFGCGISTRLSDEGEVRSKTDGNQRDRRARIAGRQAQIKPTHISTKLHIAGRALSPVSGRSVRAHMLVLVLKVVWKGSYKLGLCW